MYPSNSTPLRAFKSEEHFQFLFSRHNISILLTCFASRNCLLNHQDLPLSPIKEAQSTRNGTSNQDPSFRNRSWNHRHSPMVCPTPPPNPAQLSRQIHRRSTDDDDVPMVSLQCPIRCLCHRTEIQYPNLCSTRVLWHVLSG